MDVCRLLTAKLVMESQELWPLVRRGAWWVIEWVLAFQLPGPSGA